MRYVLAVIFTLLSIRASAQEFEIVVEPNGPRPAVKVSGRTVAMMCEGFVREFGFAPETGMISLKPKSLPSSEEQRLGEIWAIRIGNEEKEIEPIELPPPLQRLKGLVTKRINQGACFTEPKGFLTPHDIVFFTLNLDDAHAIARVLRGE